MPGPNRRAKGSRFSRESYRLLLSGFVVLPLAIAYYLVRQSWNPPWLLPATLGLALLVGQVFLRLPSRRAERHLHAPVLRPGGNAIWLASPQASFGEVIRIVYMPAEASASQGIVLYFDVGLAAKRASERDQLTLPDLGARTFFHTPESAMLLRSEAKVIAAQVEIIPLLGRQRALPTVTLEALPA